MARAAAVRAVTGSGLAMRSLLVIAVLLLAGPTASAQQVADGYIIESDSAHMTGARNIAGRFDSRGQIGLPGGVYFAPSLEEGKRVEIEYAEQLSGATDLFADPNVRFLRWRAPPRSLFTPVERAWLSIDELAAADRLDLRLGPAVEHATIFEPNTRAFTEEALTSDLGVELPMPAGGFEVFHPVDGEIAERGARLQYFTGEAMIDGRRATVEIARTDGNVQGRLRTRGQLFDLRQLTPFTYAWVPVPTVFSSEPPPDHPYDAYDRFVASDPQSAVLRESRTPQCSRTTGELNLLFFYTPAAEKSGMLFRDFSAEIDLPLREFRNALRNSQITNVTVARPAVSLLLPDYVDDAGRSCERQGPTCPHPNPWSRHLTAFMARQDVVAARREHHADIVVLIVHDPGSCGLVPDAVTTDGATAQTAYAVISYGCLVGRTTLAHEVGHILGSRHDRSPPPSATAGTNFAFVNRAEDTGWGSVGSIACYQRVNAQWEDFCSRSINEMPRYANPNMAPTDPLRAHRDEASAIRRFAPCVAAFGDNL